MSKNKKSRWTLPRPQNPARNVVEQGEPFPPASSTTASHSLAGARTPDNSEEFAGRGYAVTGPLSATKLTANRANALLSSGPVTEIGKQIVSQNATKHGLTGAFRVLASESQKEFDQLLASFLRSEDPAGEDEIAMVHQMTECVWLSRRSVRMQNDCWAIFESGTDEEKRAAHKSLALYMRYQTTHDRTFTRYATELRKRRNERRRAEHGFVSQKHKEAAEARRQQNEIRKQELHEIRKETIILRQQRIEIQNRLAGAKVSRAKTLAAAA